MRKLAILVLAALCWPLVGALAQDAAHDAPKLKRFFGSYVGRAEETVIEGAAATIKELRDIDLVAKPDGKGGLALEWTNVTLVDGRRDVPGVKRRADELRLIPARDRGFYLARTPYDPFTESQPADFLAGDPLRWATVEGDQIRVHSLVVLDDGRYELQTYTRSLTPDGIDLEWRRLIDGEPVREMTGHAVRAD